MGVFFLSGAVRFLALDRDHQAVLSDQDKAPDSWPGGSGEGSSVRPGLLPQRRPSPVNRPWDYP